MSDKKFMTFMQMRRFILKKAKDDWFETNPFKNYGHDRFHFCARKLKEEGFLKSIRIKASRIVWEITEAGDKYLDANKYDNQSKEG